MLRKCLITSTCLLVLSTAAMAAASPAEGEAFTVSRLEVAADIEGKEPAGVAESFPASTDTVFCFLEATDIAEDTEIAFAWFYDEQEVALVTLPLYQGERWRTFSSKRLAGRKGLWRVELRDASGSTVKAVSFTVE